MAGRQRRTFGEVELDPKRGQAITDEIEGLGHRRVRQRHVGAAADCEVVDDAQQRDAMAVEALPKRNHEVECGDAVEKRSKRITLLAARAGGYDGDGAVSKLV